MTESSIYYYMNHFLAKCTGVYQEEGKRPQPGTKCFGPCIYDAGRWGKSYCYTNKDRSQWGAECTKCQGKKGMNRSKGNLHIH